MAQFVFSEIARRCGNAYDFVVDSSAVSYEEIDNPLYPPARKILTEKGIPHFITHAKILEKRDYEKYDYFIGMDSSNIRRMMTIFGSDKDKKVYRLLDFTEEKRDVSDPYYTRNFDMVFDDIFLGCNALYNYLKAENENKN
jgi:protein-tyrosine phosphatase